MGYKQLEPKHFTFSGSLTRHKFPDQDVPPPTIWAPGCLGGLSWLLGGRLHLGMVRPHFYFLIIMHVQWTLSILPFIFNFFDVPIISGPRLQLPLSRRMGAGRGGKNNFKILNLKDTLALFNKKPSQAQSFRLWRLLDWFPDAPGCPCWRPPWRTCPAQAGQEGKGWIPLPNRMNFWKRGGRVIFNPKIYIADFGNF